MRYVNSILLLTLSMWGFSQPQDYNIRGLDPRVDYNLLYLQCEQAGIPWDDRNLDLTQEELNLLPQRDFEDRNRTPVFYRVFLRQTVEGLKSKGSFQYPRCAPERFEIGWGGLFRDGVFIKFEETVADGVIVNSEVNVSNQPGNAETAIAINPVNPNLVIAGANGPGGQTMYYSSDGGATWNLSSVLPNSCCDPTVAWSPDGTTAYTVTLGSFLGVDFYRSTNNGQSWGNRVDINNQFDDKEYMHVDHSATSAYQGQIYVTWHTSGKMKFAKSTDGGVTFDSPLSFNGTNGIGSDITTGSDGTIYYIWPNTSSSDIRMKKSTNGGGSFGATTTVMQTLDDYDFAVPAMDARRVFIYASVAVDLTGGPYHDRVYVCITDNNGPEQMQAANNHARIVLAWSEDLGSTWNTSIPHPTYDILTVDRFHPWIDIDQQGNVHVIYYDTQNDPNRRNPDVYHSYSKDGGVTWEPQTRITAVSSTYFNDGFQWGDYNGLAVLGTQIRPIWTDHRNTVEAYSAIMELEGNGDFSLDATNDEWVLCRGESTGTITVDITPIGDFSNPVALGFVDLPVGFDGVINGSPVVPPGQAHLELNTNSAAVFGNHEIRVLASGGGKSHDVTVAVFLRDASLLAIASWWRSNALYDADYDMDADGQLTLLDFVDLVDCDLPVP